MVDPPTKTYQTAGSPIIEQFLRSRAPLVDLMGPFGSGKSVACVMRMLLIAKEMPKGPDGVIRCRWGVVRNTYKQLADTTMATLFHWLPQIQWGRYNSEHHRYLVTGFEGMELEFLFRALDRPDHVQNLLSLELSHGWVNEAREVPVEVIGPLRGRLGRYPPVADVGPYERYLQFDTNAPDNESWLYKLFEEDRPPGAVLFRQPSGISPQAENRRNLQPDYYEQMMTTMSPGEIEVYVHGNYGYLQTGKPVYPEYNDAFHCREVEPLPNLPVLRGWDFGLTPACVFLQVLPSGAVLAFDECVAERAGIQAFAPLVLKHTAMSYAWAKKDNATVRGAVRDVGDPAGKAGVQTDEQTCFMILDAAGVDCQPGIQEPTLRLEAVRYLLRQVVDGGPGFIVHPRCKVLRKGFQGEYKYRRILTGGTTARYADKPDKNKQSHPHDALQYAAVDLVGDVVQGLMQLHTAGRQTHSVADFDPMSGDLKAQLVYEQRQLEQQAHALSDFDPLARG